MSKAIKLAIFDVDGTISRGSFGERFIKALAAEKIFTNKIMRRITDIEKEYSRGIFKRDKVTEMWNAAYRQGALGKKSKDFFALGKRVWNAAKQGSILPFVPELLGYLVKKDYEIAVISTSPKEVIVHLCEEYGISQEKCWATSVKTNENDEYLDEPELMLALARHKFEALEKLVETAFPGKEIDWDNSIGFGDSVTDMGFLRKVGRPVVVKLSSMKDNPFHDKVKKLGWIIVNEQTALQRVREIL